MTQSNADLNDIVTFLRKRDYRLVKELGQGACGKTVLLHDDQIDSHFVCKKYSPYSEDRRQELFTGFVREVKLLHQIHHQNVVRVFNYYLYPELHTGYILMEYVNGADIDNFVSANPEQMNELFLQAISGFGYLERSGILHRDIRPGNIMVTVEGTLKIIDLGFGKHIERSEDFGKSITLNWWCQTPDEFAESRYDFRTEVYFVGKLFESLIQDNGINHFKYRDALASMCQLNPADRVNGFSEVEKIVRSDQFSEIGFTEEELGVYRHFADELCGHIKKIENGAKYATDIGRIVTQLSDLYRRFMLEETVPDSSVIIHCFFTGKYYYIKTGFKVYVVKDFIKLLKSSTDERGKIILANLHTRLDALTHYTDPADDEVPF